MVLVGGLVGAGGLVGPDDARAREAGSDEVRVGPVLDDEPPEIAAVLTPPADYSLLDLAATDVTVTRDGQEVPARVEALPASELDVAVVAHLSGDAATVRAVRGAVDELVRTLPRGASVALVRAGADPAMVSPLTTDRVAVLGNLADLEPIADARLGESLAAALGALRSGSGSRGVVAVVSPAPLGTDTDGIQRVLDDGDGDSSVYLTGTGGSAPEDLGSRIAGTGGALLAASQPGALVGSTDAISGDLANQYRLRVRLASPTDGALTVRLDEGGLEPSETTVELALAGTTASAEPAPTTGRGDAVGAGPGDVGARSVGLWVLVVMAVAGIGALAVLGLRRRLTGASPGVGSRSPRSSGEDDPHTDGLRPGEGDLPVRGLPTVPVDPPVHGAVGDAGPGDGTGQHLHDRAATMGEQPAHEPVRTGPGAAVVSGPQLHRDTDRNERSVVRFAPQPPAPTEAGQIPTPSDQSGAGHQRGDGRPEDVSDEERPVVVVDAEELRAAERADAGVAWLDLALGSLPEGFPLDALILRSTWSNASHSGVPVALWELFRTRAGAGTDHAERSAEIERLVVALNLGSARVRTRGLDDALVSEIAELMRARGDEAASTAGSGGQVVGGRGPDPGTEGSDGIPALLGRRPRLATESPSLRAALAWRAIEGGWGVPGERSLLGPLAAELMLLGEGAVSDPVLELGTPKATAPNAPTSPASGTLVEALASIGAGARRTRQRLDRLVDMRDRALGEVSGPRPSRAPALVDLMLANPILTARYVADALDMTHQGALNLIRRLESKRWLRCVGAFGRGGRKYWVAPQVLATLDDGFHDHAAYTEHHQEA